MTERGFTIGEAEASAWVTRDEIHVQSVKAKDIDLPAGNYRISIIGFADSRGNRRPTSGSA